MYNDRAKRYDDVVVHRRNRATGSGRREWSDFFVAIDILVSSSRVRPIEDY